MVFWLLGFFFPEVNQLLLFVCWMLRRVHACLRCRLFLSPFFFFWDSSCTPSVKCISADFINRMVMADACGWTLLSGDTVWLVSCTHERHRRESNSPAWLLLRTNWSPHTFWSALLQHWQWGNGTPLERASEGARRPIPRNEHSSGWC